MEFDIDTELVHNVLTDEYAQARADIAEVGPIQALERSQQRHDARLEAAADAPTLACKAGCFWCCYFSVDIRPVEALRILEFVERELPAADRERIVSEIKTNGAILNSLDDDERVKRNTKCPFLHLGRCSIYQVRPQTCRNYHATDVRGCEKAYSEPENDDIDPEFAPLVYQSGNAHVEAFSNAMRDSGYDVKAYELNTALALALATPDETRLRFFHRKAPFPELEGIDVPPEFGSE